MLKCYIRKSNKVGQNEDGTLFPALLTYNTVTTEEFMDKLLSNCQIGAAQARMVLAGMAELLAQQLSDGHTVKLDGFGTFSLKMSGGIKKGRNGQLTLDEPRVSQVRFTPDGILRQTLEQVKFELLHHGVSSPRKMTADEAEAVARELLDEQGSFLTNDFVERTRLSKSSAYRLLHQLKANGVVRNAGSRRTAVYVA